MKKSRMKHFLYFLGSSGLVLLIAYIALIRYFETESNYISETSDPVDVAAYEPRHFQAGEYALYKVSLLGLPVGEASFYVEGKTMFQDQECWHFEMRSKAYIYPIYYNADSYVDRQFENAIYYQTKQLDNAEERDVKVNFFPDQNLVQYSKNGKKYDPAPIEKNCFCPLSIFYHLREQDLNTGDVLEATVSDGKKCVKSQTEVLSKETIKIGEKEYETVLIEPDTGELKGVFAKSDDARIRIWLSDDNRKIPLKIESRIFLGTFIAEVSHYEIRDTDQTDKEATE